MSGSEGGPAANAAADPSASLNRLVEVLLAGLEELADAGDPEAACRLAGRACAILRESEPRAARRFDVLLHRLAPRLSW